MGNCRRRLKPCGYDSQEPVSPPKGTTLSVPFRTYEEKNRLMQNLPSIKHELSMSGSHADWARSNDQKNLQTLKKQILNRVHAITGVPLEALDVEALSLD